MSWYLERPLLGRLYAVGDIHGCVRELEVLLKHLYDNENITENDSLVFLGDFIDRGEGSKGVIDSVAALKRENTFFLRGNHEDMFLDFIGLPGRHGASWLDNGGIQTVESYGLHFFESADELISCLPHDHLLFFKSLNIGVKIDRFLFVHAGVHPLRSLEAQKERDIFWIRNEFIKNNHRLNETVVFGHTPFDDVMIHAPYKIGIDTGVVFGGMLTCIELTEGVVHQVTAGGASIKSRKINISQSTEELIEGLQHD